MKKTILIGLSAMAMLLGSCAKEMVEVAPQTAVKQSGLTFTGYAGPATKVTIGDLNNGVYPILWAAGDKIGVFDCTDGSDMVNIPASLHSSSDGQNSGVFVTYDEYVLAEGRNDLLVVYPYHAADTSKIDIQAKTANGFLIPTEQKQLKANDSGSIGDYAFAYASTSVVKDSEDKPTFTLNHVNTYVKITVSSSEFAHYKLERVSIADKSKENAEVLTGSITANLTDGTFTVKNGASQATVSIEEPSSLANPQTVYLSVLPCDFTGKDAYIVVTMSNENQTVTIPVTVAGKKIAPNALNIIEVQDVKMSDNTCTWFDPVETRQLVGGWCYGNQNTIPLINGGDNVTVSAKAHGDFANVVEPKYVAINFTYQHDGTNKFSNIKINDTALSSVNEMMFKNTNYKAAVKFDLDDNYEFEIRSLDVSGWGAPGSLGRVALLDADENIIWAFNIWNMKNEIKEFTTANGYTLMDKNLGGCSYEETNAATRNAAFFQWGRPFAQAWGASLVDGMSTTAVSLKESAALCLRMLYYNNAPFTTTDWYLGQAGVNIRSEHRDDLWGNPNQEVDSWSTDGVKTIFDPCPKGWMVASPKALSDIEANGRLQVETVGSNKHFWIVYEKSATDKLYFPYGGLKWGSNAGNPNNNFNDVCSIWTNMSYAPASSSVYSSYMVWWRAKGSETGNAIQNASQGRATAASVRCMKDNDNR